ncbi:MAG: phage tailspike protein [Plesiomonas shigelloides]
MTANIMVTSPYQPFTLPNKFSAVFNGYIYCGLVDKDPLVPANQVQVYLVNEDGSQVPVPQPLRTNAGGFLVYNGKPARFVTYTNHSLLVQDSRKGQVWYEPDVSKIDPQTAISILGSQSREALRRSYANAGYNLVTGSLESGGVISGEYDVILQESTGKAYSGPIGQVNPGTIPSPPAFTDRGDKLNGFRLSSPDATLRPLSEKVGAIASVKDFEGVVGDGVHDDTDGLKNAITWCAQNRITLLWEEGKYNVSRIHVNGAGYVFKWVTNGPVEISSNATSPLGPMWIDDYFIKLGGGNKEAIDYSDALISGGTSIKLSSGYSVSRGDLILIESNRLIQSDSRGQAREGELHLVDKFESGLAYICSPLYFFHSASGDVSTLVSSVTSASEFSITDTSQLSATYFQVKVTGVTGRNAGVSRFITDYNVATKTIKFEGNQGPFPYAPAVGDSFTITKKANLFKSTPCTGDVSGDFKFSRPITTNARPGDLGFRGLVIENSVDFNLDIKSVSGFSEAGIFPLQCYRAAFMPVEIDHSNRAYALYDGTGYGISVYSCMLCTFNEPSSFACRRTIDISGGGIVSLYNRVIGPKATGGGTAYDGVSFFPAGDTRNSMNGGHGASYETEYIGGTSIDTYHSSVLRGVNERLKDVNSRGFSGPHPILAQYGVGGAIIEGCNYEDGFTEDTASYSQWYKPVSATFRSKRPLALINITAYNNSANTYYKKLPLIIKNNTARGVTRALLRIESDTSSPAQIENILFGGNVCIASPLDDGSDESAALVYSSVPDAIIVKSLQDLGGNRLICNGVEYKNFALYATPSNMVGVIDKGDGEFIANVSAGKCVKLKHDTYVPNVRLTISGRDSSTVAGVEMIIHRTESIDFSPLSNSNKRGIAIKSGPLSDGSGDAGFMNISFDGGYVYLSNRTSSDLNLSVSIK